MRAGYGRSVFEPLLPLILGRDVSGEVASIGRSVRSFSVGEEVFGALQPTAVRGTYADYSILPADKVAKKPAAISHVDACALPFAALTAWRALKSTAMITSGQRVLIIGGGGAVGFSATQLSVAAGCHATTTVGGESVEHVLAAGAEKAVDYTTEDCEVAIKGHFDAVLDTIGLPETERLGVNVLRKGGHYMTLQGEAASLSDHYGYNHQNVGNELVGYKKIRNLRSNLRIPSSQKDNFDGIGRGFGEVQHMGSFGSCLGLSLNDKWPDEGVGRDDTKNWHNYVEDDEFGILDSYHKDCKKSGESDRRYEVDESEFRHPLVRETCRLVRLRFKWNPDLEGQLKNLLRSLKPRQVCAVLHSQDDERIALEFFYWADRQWRYRHDPVVYYAMLQILGKTKLCQGARRVLHLMHRRGIRRTPEAFCYLMVSYSRAGKVRHAMGVLRMMQMAGVQPNLSVCNTAFHVLVMANRLDKALRFLKRMQNVGIAPNVVTYNCLIKGYCDANQVEDAIKLIDNMPLRGCAPDKVSFYTVINYFCKEKRLAEIQLLLEKMMGCNLLLDMVTYNNLIHMLCKYGHSDEAYNFIREAQERGFRVDKVGYTALVHSLCREGRIDRAEEIVNEMFEKDCIPDVVTYTAIVDGFCRAGRVDEAKKKLQQMYKNGCKPNTVSYTALVKGLCQIGCSAEARDMMNKSEEEWWTPNSITYSVVMYGFHREGKLLEACEVVREMILKGFPPSPAEINLLLVSLCREGRTDEAKRFMQECMSKGCDINVVNFTTVIHGHFQKDNLEGALSLLDDMYLVNKSPDLVTYTTIVDALARRGKFEEATELIKEMLGRGILPNPVMYRMIIHRFCQNGRVEDLLKLLEKLLPKQPYQTAYNQVIEKLCSFGYISEAYHLLGKVLRTASRIDAQSCHVLMQSYLNIGSPLLAYKVACRMFKRNLIPDINLCEKVSKKLTLNGNIKEADSLMIQFVERGLVSPC